MRGRLERRILDAIAIDLPDVEVFLHFLDVFLGDVVRGAPDAI